MVYINLKTANRPQVYKDPEQNLQIEVLKAICDELTSLVEEIDNDVEKSRIEAVRRHDTIFIDGERGTGKTALMLNIQSYYEKVQEKSGLYFIGPIDPTLLYDNEDFLGVVLGSVIEAVEEHMNERCREEDDAKRRHYYEALQKVSDSLGAVMKLRRYDELEGGVEAIAANASSKALEQHVHLFFKATAGLLGAKALVLLIDDVDMAFKKGFEVLEVVRKFLASPYIIPIVSGDGKLYKRLLCNQFRRDVACEEKRCESNEPMIDDIVNQYFNKVMPNDNRHTIRPIYQIEPDIYIGQEKIVSFRTLNRCADELINRYVRREEEKLTVFPKENVRSFVQLASKLEPVIERMKACENQNSKSFFDDLLSNQKGLYKKFLAGIEEFYRYSTDVKKFRLSVLCKNDLEAFRSGHIDGYAAFRGRFFQDKNYQKSLKSALFGCSQKIEMEEFYKINEEIKGKIYIRKPDDESEVKAWENAKAADKFVVYLIGHDDYYARSENTRLLVYAGRLVSFLLFALSNEIKRVEEAEKIFFEKPFNAGGLEKDFDPEIQYSDEFDEEDRKQDEIDEENLKKLGKKSAWERIKEDGCVKEFFSYRMEKHSLNSHAIHEILHKFFNNWNILKEGYSPTWDDRGVALLAQRMVWIFLNAVAYFENDKQSSKTNIAMTDNKFKESNMINSETYRINLKELLEDENSLTYAFYHHPLVQYIVGQCGDKEFDPKFTQIGQRQSIKPGATIKELRSKIGINSKNIEDKAIEYIRFLMKEINQNRGIKKLITITGGTIEAKAFKTLKYSQEPQLQKLAEEFKQLLQS